MKPSRRQRLTMVATFSLGAALAAPARADEVWLLSGEAPGAMALTEPQSDWFGVGGLPSIALYRSLGAKALFGARLRGGLLLDGDAPEQMGYADRGTGGLATLTGALRLRPAGDGDRVERGTGPWLELGGGGALTGELVRPTFEAGVGWNFAAGSVDLGPSLRYLQVVQPKSDLDGKDAKLALLGIEITLLDARPTAAPIVREELPPPPPPPVLDTDGDGILDPDDKCVSDPEDLDGFEDTDGCPEADNDGDKIADKDDKCPMEAEVVNGVDDADGCPDEGLFKMVDDRIVLEDRVLFDTGRARVRTSGREVLEAIVKWWQEHPEYDRLVIEGHADYRGTDNYNLKLSEQRAKRVQEMLIHKLGVDRAKISFEALGESHPLATGTDPESLEKNRRVEFVMIRSIKVDATTGKPVPDQPAPGTTPPSPDAPAPSPSAPPAPVTPAPER